MIWILLAFVAGPIQNQLLDAHQLYEAGEMNQALEQYREIAHQAESDELFFNMGACCYQLDEMAWSVYYFAKGGDLVQADKARAELGLGPLPRRFPIGLRDLLVPMAVASGFVLLLGSVAIWSRRRALRRWTLSLLTVLGLLYGGMLYIHLFSPPQGVVVRSSAVRAEPEGGERVAMAPAGTLVRVLRGGEALFVETESGQRGYLTTGTVQLF